MATCFLPFAAAYFLSYLFRSVNAVVGPAIAAEFTLDAAALGALTSAYFAAFALAQMPLGIALDRYGARRVQGVLLLAAVAGGMMFALASSGAQLTLGRALIGLGVSGCLMAAFSANAAFWPRQQLPYLNGFLLACGGLGATAATLPAQWLMAAVGWRPIFAGLAGVTLAVLAAIWVLAPDPRRPTDGHEHWRTQVAGVFTVLRAPVFWRMAPMSVATQSVFLTYQGLWAGPWLRDVAGLSPDGVATLLFITSAVMIAGFASAGPIYTAMTSRGLSDDAAIATLAVIFVGIQVPLSLGIAALGPVLWPAFGFAGTTSAALTFAWLTQRFPIHLSGRVNTSLNLLVFVAAFVAQAGIGLVIDWAGAHGPGAPDPGGHRVAFMALLALEAFGIVWFLRHAPSRD